MILLEVASAILIVVAFGYMVRGVRRLGPGQLDAKSLANQLYRHPDRFFLIVPWCLAECSKRGRDAGALLTDIAKEWCSLGNFQSQSEVLMAFLKLKAEPTPPQLIQLLDLLLTCQDNPLVREGRSGVAASAVACLDALKVARMLADGTPKAHTVGMLPRAGEVLKQYESVQSQYKLIPKSSDGTLGKYDDSQVLKEWRRLLVVICKRIQPEWEDECDPSGNLLTQKEAKAKQRQRKAKKRSSVRSSGHKGVTHEPMLRWHARQFFYLGFVWLAAAEMLEGADISHA